MVGLSGMGCEHSHSRETLTGHGRLESGARLQRKAARTALAVVAAPLFRRCYGPDFRSRAFKRGCQDVGIAIEWRPPGEPRFGGHIERLIGTQMGKLHLLPGTTFSNAQELGEYDSKRHAVLTLRELERYIALDIVGCYHQSIHSSLGRPPIAVWREHEGEIPLRLPQDRLRFWLTFLPEQERTLRPTDIHLFGLRY
ncbi:hypothetical protein [Mesorhizobium onobrychidis]|uniref:hypothetical protein n=1 Tax=Mesorhizobium onobrychidis TaxID=2775404 RepID=UPI0021582C71|nr:hypothetical protein [Mesorhizobium onobrychidis]